MKNKLISKRKVKKCQEGEILDLQMYTAGYADPVTVTASKKLNKRLQMQADEDWRLYLQEHPIQIGSEEYNKLPEKAKAQVYKNKVIDDTNKMALPTAAAIVAPTALAAAGTSAVPLIEGVAADWATLGPILKEFGKQALASQMGYDAVSAAYRLGSEGRDLLTDTGNLLFPNMKNQFIKNTLAGLANPGGWIGVPRVYVNQILNNMGKSTITFLDSNPITRTLATGDPYTTISGKFGYYGNNLLERIGLTVKRRLNIKTTPKHPEFLRKIDARFLTTDKNGNLDLSAGSRQYKDFLNFTTDRHVVSHNKGDWDIFPGLIVDPKELSLYTPISIEPSDTFFRKLPNMTVNPKHVTFVSGNIADLNKAKSMGMDILSSSKLRHIYRKMKKESLLGLNDKYYRSGRSQYRGDYTKEIQRLTTKRGSPNINDYKYIENLYGLNSGTVDIKNINIQNMIDNYRKGLLVYYPNNSLWGRHDPSYVKSRKYNKVFYDPASSVENDYIKKMSVPQLYSDLHTLGFKLGGFLFPNLTFSHKFDDGGVLNNIKKSRIAI